MSSAADNDREDRFKHLLQPIRDLAQNWDVDIATSLEDYLEDLEEITITLDGGASKVNFAEAALLIQGSTCVYSRKVEHVYQLVVRTIEFLTQQKQQKQAGASNGPNSADSDDTGGGAGDETVFLPLDDVLEEGKHIDLAVEGRRRRGGRRSSVGTVAFAEGSVDGGDEAGAGRVGGRVGGAQDISRPPMFLMEQDYGNSFKMSTCAVDQSGALLIEGAKDSSGGGSFSLSLSVTSDGGRVGLSGGAARSCDFWGGLGRRAADGGDGEGRLVGGGAGGGGDGLGGVDNDDDSDGGGGGGYGAGFGDNDEAEGGQPLFRGLHTPNATSSAMASDRELRERASKDVSESTTTFDSLRRADPWAPLDAHDPGGAQARPIRKGRTYRLPPQLRKRRGQKKGQGDGAGFDALVEKQTNVGGSWVSRDGKLKMSVPLLGLAYPEFQYVSTRERHRKSRQARLARQQIREFMGREDFLAESASSIVKASLMSNPNGDVGPVDNYEGLGSDGGYSSDGGGGGGGGYGDYGDNSSDIEGEGFHDGGGDVGGQDVGVAPISLEDAFRDKPQTYEDLCRSHIEAFMRGTEKYAHETQLSRRVGAWQEKLEPLMRRQEKRQAFDIHEYGQSVLTRVVSVLPPSDRARAQKAVKGAAPKKVGDKSTAGNGQGDAEEAVEDMPLVDFGLVVGGKERFDVCRLFLASLQLANNGNVRLSHGDNAAEQESTPFQLELLSLQDAHNMHGYFAPSAVAGADPKNAPENDTENAPQNAETAAPKPKARRRGGTGVVVGVRKKGGALVQATA